VQVVTKDAVQVDINGHMHPQLTHQSRRWGRHSLLLLLCWHCFLLLLLLLLVQRAEAAGQQLCEGAGNVALGCSHDIPFSAEDGGSEMQGSLCKLFLGL
jgi:hypothetical protein